MSYKMNMLLVIKTGYFATFRISLKLVSGVLRQNNSCNLCESIFQATTYATWIISHLYNISRVIFYGCLVIIGLKFPDSIRISNILWTGLTVYVSTRASTIASDSIEEFI